MLMTSERRPVIRTIRGWAISVLQEAGAIRQSKEHGWMQDRADPHARERAFDIAREDPPAGLSPDAAAAEFVTYWIRLQMPARNASLTRRTGAEHRRQPGPSPQRPSRFSTRLHLELIGSGLCPTSENPKFKLTGRANQCSMEHLGCLQENGMSDRVPSSSRF